MYNRVILGKALVLPVVLFSKMSLTQKRLLRQNEIDSCANGEDSFEKAKNITEDKSVCVAGMQWSEFQQKEGWKKS